MFLVELIANKTPKLEDSDTEVAKANNCLYHEYFNADNHDLDGMRQHVQKLHPKLSQKHFSYI